MALGKRNSVKQEDLWIPATELPSTAAHPFYKRVNEVLAKNGFDRFAEETCQRFYSDGLGRPSIPPGNYFRLLMIGYFEGIDSERGIAWRVGDSLSLRSFLGLSLSDATPDHSSMSRIRRRISLEAHDKIFGWVLQVLAQEKIFSGKTIGVDATNLEANAAMRNIARRDSGATYKEFLTQLAKESGIETPTNDDLIRLDRKREKKTSNQEWVSKSDPDSRIAKMKDGSTHLAHKVEHAVDMESGAVVGVTVQGADKGDTTTIRETLHTTLIGLLNISAPIDNPGFHASILKEVVADKGYHSGAVLLDQADFGFKTFISEPDRGKRNWTDRKDEQRPTYLNRARIRSDRGKNLMRRRGELVERSFAHCYETGAMRRLHLRGRDNITKRLLIHIAGFNLSLIMRKIFGVGTPRRWQDLFGGVLCAIQYLLASIFIFRIGDQPTPRILRDRMLAP